MEEDGGKGGAGVLRLPRTKQKSIFFLHPFRRSAISCVVPAVSMLHLLLLNHFLFMASKNFLVKSATRSAFTVPFGQASLFFFLSPPCTGLSE